VYEDLEPIAQLKFGKEMEAISKLTRANVQEAQAHYAALTATSGVRSGQHEASIARKWIEGSERLVRSLFDIWVDLIKQRNGHIARADVGFVASKIEGFTKTQTAHLNKVLRQRHGAIIPMLTEEAGRRMYAASSSARRDLEIMALENKAFSKSATAAQGAQTPPAPEPRSPNSVETPSPPAEKPDKGLFVGIFGIVATLVLFGLQANGVDLNWPASFVLYIASACACAWTFSKHAVPHKRKLVRYGGGFLLFATIMAIGSCGTFKQFRREHPLPESKVDAPLSPESEQEKVRAVNDEQHNDFEKEFSLGYKLFGIANKGFFPFQGTLDHGFIVHWERQNYSWNGDDNTVILHLPDIDIQPNILLRGTTVSLPNKPGGSITFRLDPKSFQRGAAIVSNSFERIEEGGKEPSATRPNGGATLEGFPGASRIAYLMQSTIRWGSEDYYQLGKTEQMGDRLRVTGGVLNTSRVDVFDDAELIRGNTFYGGPRGGYEFPKAGTVVGNKFLESVFDASRLPDGAIVANNRFVSEKGVYTVGPQPEISFVVKIVQTEKDGAVLLFGAKPYTDDEVRP
jgi:hypothetical protein